MEDAPRVSRIATRQAGVFHFGLPAAWVGVFQQCDRGALKGLPWSSATPWDCRTAAQRAAAIAAAAAEWPEEIAARAAGFRRRRLRADGGWEYF